MMRRFALVLVFAGFGCSFALVSGPPSNHRQLPYFDCTTSRAGPVLDTIWTALQTTNLVYAISRTDMELRNEINISRGIAIPMYAAFAALGAAGMYYGFTRTGECKRAKGELAVRLMTPTGPQPGTWPPPQQPGTWPPPTQQPAPPPAPPGPAPTPAPPPAPAPAPAPSGPGPATPPPAGAS